MNELVLGEALEELIDYRGKTPKKLGADFTDSGVPVASALLVSNGTLNLADARTVSHETYQSWMKTTTRKGDVLLTSEAPLGRVARVPSDDPLVLGQRLFGLRGKSGILDNGYLYYALQTADVQSDLVGRSSGTTVFGIRQSALRQVKIAAPDIDRQRAVADVLSALDNKIAANSKLAATASTLAGLIYDQATGQIESQPMSQVLQPVLGGTPPRSRDDFWDGDQRWASAKDITGADFGVVIDTVEKITGLAVASTKAKPLPKGSVILTARGTVGAVARLAAPASFNQSCYGFVPGVVPPGVLFFAIARATERAKEIAHGSVFDTITMKTFDHLAFPRFDSASMCETESKIGPLLESVSAAVTENSGLASTRDALLPQLMSGKLRVRDAAKVLEDAGV